jgi:hypothetical protein
VELRDRIVHDLREIEYGISFLTLVAQHSDGSLVT